MSDLDDPVSSFEDDLLVSWRVVLSDDIGTLILNTVDNCEGRRGERKEREVVCIKYRHINFRCVTHQSDLVTSQTQSSNQNLPSHKPPLGDRCLADYLRVLGKRDSLEAEMKWTLNKF